MIQLFSSKPLINIEIKGQKIKKNNSSFISATPFFTVTESPKFLYIAIMDFSNNIAYTGRMFIKKYPQTPAALRGCIKIFIKEFIKQLNLIKIKKMTFTTVSREEVITDITRLVIQEFRKYNLIK